MNHFFKENMTLKILGKLEQSILITVSARLDSRRRTTQVLYKTTHNDLKNEEK